MMFRSVLAAVAGLFGASVAAAQSPQADAFRVSHQRARLALEQNPQLVADPAGVIVQFRAGLGDAAKAALLRQVQGQSVIRYSIVPGLEKIETTIGVDRALAALRADPAVEYAHPDYVLKALATPNDPSYGVLWGMRNIGQTVNGSTGTAGADIRAEQAWDVSTGDPNFVIADIDTGMQLNHPDLSANLWVNPGEVAGNGIDDDGNGYIDDMNGWDFWDRDSVPQDSGSHGTHTAGTIGARGNNGVGVVGVNWQCKIMVLKFLGPSGGYTSDAILAMQYATAKGVKVSNNSWGGGPFDQGLYNAINASKTVGHVFVAAAGNSGVNADNSPMYPAAYNLDNIISVAATDNRDNRASFSNYGATSVDLGAPGVNIYSTVPTNGYAYFNGTSMAAPHVTGVVALVYARNPTWTYQQVRSRILTTVRPVSSLAGITVTGGVLNASAALAGGTGNTAPTVTISSPSNGSSVVQGTSVTFTGSSTDAQDGSLSAGIVWTSNLMGQIGTGASFSRSDLTVGTHTVTASSTDSGALTGTAVVQISVTSNNPAPAAPSGVTASSPSAGTANVRWTDNSNNETTFEIQRQTRLSNGAWGTATTVGTVGANVTSFTQSTAAGRYRYRVRATNSGGSSAWTSWSSTVRVR